METVFCDLSGRKTEELLLASLMACEICAEFLTRELTKLTGVSRNDTEETRTAMRKLLSELPETAGSLDLKNLN
jgi:hypothetical protein